MGRDLGHGLTRVRNTFHPPGIKECGCVTDPDPETDGLIIAVCERHAWETSAAECRYRRLMDEEVEQVVKGQGNRTGPLARAVGVIGDFAVAKR